MSGSNFPDMSQHHCVSIVPQTSTLDNDSAALHSTHNFLLAHYKMEICRLLPTMSLSVETQ